MKLHLIRHPKVAATFDGICYGVTDVPLAEPPSAEIVDQCRALGAELIVSSDLRRCAALATAIAAPAAPRLDARWRERNFGDWEGRAWGAIHAAVPDDIGRLMQVDFAPPGGESLARMHVRIAAALHDLPKTRVVLVVAHGGSIALARLILSGAPMSNAPAVIPAHGEIVSLAAP